MFIPPEFADYMITKSHLTAQDQFDRFLKMHLAEIEERGKMLRNLRFDKEEAKKRIRSYVKWSFEFYTTPEFVNEIDATIEKVYADKSPKGW